MHLSCGWSVVAETGICPYDRRHVSSFACLGGIGPKTSQYDFTTVALNVISACDVEATRD